MKLSKILLIAIGFIAFNSAQAQTPPKVTTTAATGLPDWGVAGYDNATYYYIPAMETYYDVRTRNYVYMQNGKWERTATVPTTYKNYDLYNGYKVVLTDENDPYGDYDNIRVKYPKNYKGETQKAIKPRQ